MEKEVVKRGFNQATIKWEVKWVEDSYYWS